MTADNFAKCNPGMGRDPQRVIAESGHTCSTIWLSTFNSEGFVRMAYVVHYTQAERPSARLPLPTKV